MAFLFFAAVLTLLGWLACEHDLFSSVPSVPAADPHTAPSPPPSSPSASAPAGPVVSPSPSPSPSLPRRERQALVRSRSRSPPPVPAWARPDSFLSPPQYHRVENKYDTFLDVKSTEKFAQMERVWDPMNGWKWAAVRGERLAARMIPLPNSPLPSPVVASQSPPTMILSAPVAAPPPVAVVPRPAPVVFTPARSVASILAGIPSLPEGLPQIFPLPVAAPQPPPQPLFSWMTLAAPTNYAPGSLAMVLPDFTPPVPTPLTPPPPPPPFPSLPAGADHKPQAEETPEFVDPPPPSPSLPAGADHKPQTDDISGSVAAPPPPPPPYFSSSFAFSGGDFGGVTTGTAPAPPFGGTFGAGFDFSAPTSFSSAAPSTSAPRRRGDRRGNIIFKKVDDLRIEDDRDDDDSLMEKYWDAGLDTYELVMGADLPMVSTSGLEKIAGYISGSTLASFELNLRQKEDGLRRLTNLLRWQCSSPRPQPPGGTPALGQLITVLARVDELVRGFVADKGGQQQQFVGGDFFKWARAWRYFEKYGWQAYKANLQLELDPAVFGELVELVRRHQAHWVRFLREAPSEGKGRDW